MQKRTIIFIAAAVIFSSAMLSSAAQASMMRGGNRGGRRGGFNTTTLMHGQLLLGKPVVMGIVSAINGTTLTVTNRQSTVYTVDVSNAKITTGRAAKPQTLTIADIKVGDTVMVSGTASGTAVTATSIFDKVNKKNNNDDDDERPGMMATTTRGVFGKVTAVNGSVFTVESVGIRNHGWSTTSSTTSTFAVATNSTTTFTKDGKPATLADVTAGVSVMVRGTVDRVAHTATATNVNIVTLQMRPRHFDFESMRSFEKMFGRGRMHNKK